MRRALPWVLVGLGGALLLAGIAVFWLANVAPPGADFGWTAYAPLEPGVPRRYVSEIAFPVGGSTVVWTGQHLLGAGLAVLGLLVLAASVGWLLGRRAGRRPTAG